MKGRGRKKRGGRKNMNRKGEEEMRMKKNREL